MGMKGRLIRNNNDKETDQVAGAGSKRRHAKENRMSDGKNEKECIRRWMNQEGWNRVKMSQENHSWGD